MYQVTKNKYLEESEIEALKSYFKGNESRDAIMLELCLTTGARSKEILLIRRQDINLDLGTVFIHGVKGSLSREIPISPELTKKLKSYLGKNKIKLSERAFPINSRRFRQIWNDLMPHLKGTDDKQGRGLHSLRHTFAINLFKKHRDIRLVQFALGHRSINNTLVYSEYVYKTEELRKVLTDEE